MGKKAIWRTSVDFSICYKRFAIVSHVWELKAFESQIRICLFEYRQIRGHYVSTLEGGGLDFTLMGI